MSEASGGSSSDSDVRRRTDFRAQIGGATLNLLIFLLLMGTVAYGGLQYVPVAYNASALRDFMQREVERASAMGHTAESLRSQLRAGAAEYSVPAEAKIRTEQRDGYLQATVQFTRPVAFLPGYTYNYEFDYTARSTKFLGER